MATTIKDVAKLADTSTATVSKVINGSYSISEATAERVRAAMRELKYTPNRRAQSFARQASGSVAFVTTLERDVAFQNPHMFEIMSGLQHALARKGYSLVVIDMAEGNCAAVEELMLQKSADGIVFHAAIMTRELSQLILRYEFPHVVIGTPNFPSKLCWIDNNNPLSGELAALHLLETGKRRIAYIGGKEADAISEARLKGAKLAMQEARLKFRDDLLMRGESTIEDGFDMTRRLLSGQMRPDAIVCANNRLALGCINALNAEKVAIPEEIAVVTFDDYPFSRITNPPLTVVNIDVYDLGSQAGKMVIDKIKKPKLQFQTYITLPKLIIRESTKKRQ